MRILVATSSKRPELMVGEQSAINVTFGFLGIFLTWIISLLCRANYGYSLRNERIKARKTCLPSNEV